MGKYLESRRASEAIVQQDWAFTLPNALLELIIQREARDSVCASDRANAMEASLVGVSILR